MEESGNCEAKERILNASTKLFSQKGFDATSVNEIADAANVTKALIYYYFKSKKDILDHLVRSLVQEATSITMDFIHTNIVEMIKTGRLDIKPDRLSFADDEAIQYFLKNAHTYYERVLDYVLERRHIIRILMLESLKSGAHHKELFVLMDFVKSTYENPIYKAISDADNDFAYTDDMMLFKFFFSVVPLVSFAAYYDYCKEISSLSEEELRKSFLRSADIIFASLVSGRDILLQNKRIKN